MKLKKAIACLLALPLALSACGAQTPDAAPSTPPAETTQTTETAPETPTPAVGTAGRLRKASMLLTATDAGLYSMNQSYDEETNTDIFYLIKTDCDTAKQENLAEIKLQGGLSYGMAVWDDTVELYLYENADQDNPTEWRYIVDTATGNVERQPVDEKFFPYWCDDAAVYDMDNGSGSRIIRLDRATNEISYINLPQQTQSIYGVGEKWLIQRIVSPSPLPSEDTGDMYKAVLQNSEKEFDLLDAATGEMQKLYSYPAVGEEYYYRGQHDDTLYFTRYGEDGFQVGVDKLENGEMVQVLELTDSYVKWDIMTDEQGELQWFVLSSADAVEVYDLNDGQTYHPAFQVGTSTNASTGYPRALLPDGRVFVTYGNAPDNGLWDQEAYATIDCAAYLAGSTDYTSITMYTGE